MDFSIKSLLQRPFSYLEPDASVSQAPKQRGYKVESVPLGDAVEGAMPAGGAPHPRPNLPVPKQVKLSTTAQLDGNLNYLRPMLKRCVEKTESVLHMHMHAIGRLSASEMAERLTCFEMRRIMQRFQVLCTSLNIPTVPPNEHLLGTLALGVLVLGEDSADDFVNFMVPFIRAGDPPEVITEILILAMPVTPSQYQSFVNVVAQVYAWAENAATWCTFIKFARPLWLQSPARCTESLANLTLLMRAHRSGLTDDETTQVIDHVGRSNHTSGGSDAFRGLVDQLCHHHIRRGGGPLKSTSFSQNVALLAQSTSAELQQLETLWWRCKAKGYKGFQFKTVIRSFMHTTPPKWQSLCNHVLYFADSSMTTHHINKLFRLFTDDDSAIFIDQALLLRKRFRGAKRINHLLALTNVPILERPAYVSAVIQDRGSAFHKERPC